MELRGDYIDIKIAGKEEDISKTIEELLELNTLIPKRVKKERLSTTEKQLDKDDYANKESRGEEGCLTEKQMVEHDRHIEEIDPTIIEIKFETTSASDGGHNTDAWDKDDQKVRGHKNVQPLWHQIYKQEDDRKKIDKGQLDKKK